ncbi:metal ABC transporter solute-binding protein, Zn/Mn family [Leptolyngbya sp. AN03gr2]|uniref:metal ABC transporter solute-binding protein, Zn/Mn family n=1 Tax=unclassified Leptolyngbya TaxID=2650499 RepID=UPI003D314009
MDKPFRLRWTVATIAIALSGFACTPQSPSTNQSAPTPQASPVSEGVPKVVATNTILCDLTRQIAAATVNLTCLVKPGADPHVYQATPEDRKAIEQANLVLYGGYNFEPTLIKLIQASSNSAPKVAVNELAVPKPQQFEEDGKTEADPHVWHNAQNGVRIAEVIRDNLAKIAPNNATLYADNAKKVTGEIGQIDSWIKTQISTIPQASRTLVTTHDALGYYSQAYNIPVAALEGISTEEKPTAAKVKELVGEIQEKKVPTIYAELSVNPQVIQTVANEANVKVAEAEIYADGLGEAGSRGETYQKMLIANTIAIVEGLGGQLTPFQSK